MMHAGAPPEARVANTPDSVRLLQDLIYQGAGQATIKIDATPRPVTQRFRAYSRSICSSVLPLVSDTRAKTKASPAKQIPA